MALVFAIPPRTKMLFAYAIRRFREGGPFVESHET